MSEKLTHGQVSEGFKELDYLDYTLNPANSSFSKPIRDSDIPNYWQIFVDNNFVATLYNFNRFHAIEDMRYLTHAKILKEDPEDCPISQDKIDLVYEILSKLTNGIVLSDDISPSLLDGITMSL